MLQGSVANIPDTAQHRPRKLLLQIGPSGGGVTETFDSYRQREEDLQCAVRSA